MCGDVVADIGPVSEADIARRLDRLARSPRVQVRAAGRSHEGRDIWHVLVTHEDNIARLEWHRRRAAARHEPETFAPFVEAPTPTAPPSQGEAFGVLLAGTSFGHEAGHPEAILRSAELLAWSERPSDIEVLRRLMVHHIPVMNPDGWARNLELWGRYPRAVGFAETSEGLYLNRDFLSLVTPEARAVVDVLERWRPIVVWDSHEDIYILGVADPAKCWCPSRTTGTVHDAPERIRALVEETGEAIAAAWDKIGYHRLADDMFPEVAMSPYAGRLISGASLRGVIPIITESSRTPGVQSLEDRVGQKVSAAMALLRHTAANCDRLADELRKTRLESYLREPGDALMIRRDGRDPAGFRTVMNVLRRHGVAVFECPSAPGVALVPSTQPHWRLAEAVVMLSQDNATAIGSTVRCGVQKLSSAGVEARNKLQAAGIWKLRAVRESEICVSGTLEGTAGTYAFANTVDGIGLVNRLWQQGSRVARLDRAVHVDGFGQLWPGDFVVQDTTFEMLQSRGMGLDVSIACVRDPTKLNQWSIEQVGSPRIALYAGQGAVSGAESTWGEAAYTLRRLGFSFVLFDADDVRDSTLSTVDVLVVPSADASELVNGWDPTKITHRDPWQLPGAPHGLGRIGLRAIESFVRTGGYLLTMGGACLLVNELFAGHIELQTVPSSAGSTPANVLNIQQDHPFLRGVGIPVGERDDRSRWLGYYHGYHDAAHSRTSREAPLFRLGHRGSTLARFDGLPFLGIETSANAEAFAPGRETVALGAQRVGLGQVIVTPLRLGFRGTWTDSQVVLSNVVLDAASQRATWPSLGNSAGPLPQERRIACRRGVARAEERSSRNSLSLGRQRS